MAKEKVKKEKEKENVKDKEKKKNLSVFTKPQLVEYTLDIFKRNSSKTYNYKEISKKLGVKDKHTKMLVNDVLYELSSTEKLEEIYAGKFRLKSKGGYITGTVDLTQHGSGYIISPEVQEDVFVRRENLNHALHGDEVKVYIYARRKNQKLEGEITEIIKRAKTTFVGLVEISKSFAFLVSDSKNMPYDIFIPLAKLNNAKNGQKAIAEITEWPAKSKNPIGEIVEVLGNVGENEVEMHAILAEYNLPYKFPEVVVLASEEIPGEITAAEIAKRVDFRNVTTLTIDPEDAKDFDDALSIRKLDNGNWEIGVHIADVTHYVVADTIVDKEAQERGTSVYLVDRVVPMLPERLSNNICSLRPHEDKLTFSAIFEMDDNAEIKKRSFARTIINSDRRFAYEEAQQIIETGEGDYASDVLTLYRLSQIIRVQRFKNGSIAFDKVEVKFRLDENNKPVDIYFKEQKESNQLIEEFMLLANKAVAEHVGDVKNQTPKTFVYRIHDEPNPEKLANFSEFIKRFGYSIKMRSHKQVYDSINQLLIEIEGKNEQNIIEQLAIRSMAKAEYSIKNIGHYGLAFKHYTHFTSPIRRYPDMMVHRLLIKYLTGGKSANEKPYEAMCKHSSDMERRAALAERASDKYKQIEFMKDKIGRVYSGMISGVTEWGIYVEIVENKIEGMISLKSMDDDVYVFHEKQFCITGQHTHKKYQLGDHVQVKVERVNLERRQLDFKFYTYAK